jgi:hypothetical protein
VKVLGYFQRKANDYERWLAGMRRVRDGLRSGGFLRVRPPRKMHHERWPGAIFF